MAPWATVTLAGVGLAGGGLDGDCRRRESYCSIRFFKAWLFAHDRRSGFAAVVAHDGAHSVYLRENECITISWQVETLDRERPEIALGGWSGSQPRAWSRLNFANFGVPVL